MSCPICERDFVEGDDEYVVRVWKRGLETLLYCSDKHEDNLAQVFRKTPLPILLHDVCRIKYTRPRYKQDVRKVEILEESLRPLRNKDRANKRQIEKDRSTCVDFALVSVKEDDCKDFLPENFAETETVAKSSVPPNVVKSEPITEDEKTVNLSAVRKRILGPYDPSQPFPYLDRCIICTNDLRVAFDRKLGKPNGQRKNRTMRAQSGSYRLLTTVLLKDQTAEKLTILQRIRDVDLVAVNAGWHRLCLLFLYRVPRTGGRLSDIRAAMDKIYNYIDGSSKQDFTIQELKNIVKDMDYIANITIRRHLKKKYRKRLTAGYDNKICITRLSVSKNNECDSANNRLRLATQSKSVNMLNDSGENSTMKVEDDECMMEADQTGRDDYDDDDDYLPPEQEKPDRWQMGDISLLNDKVSAKESNTYKLHCASCLTVDRKLNELGEFEEIYKKICLDIDFRYSKLMVICWECRALLRNAKRLYERVQRAQKVLSQVTDEENTPKSLSSLSITFPANAKISYVPNNKLEHTSREIEISQHRDETDTLRKLSDFEDLENKYDDDDINGKEYEIPPSTKVQRKCVVIDDDDMYKNTDDVVITESTETVIMKSELRNEGVIYEENCTPEPPDATDVHDTFNDKIKSSITFSDGTDDINKCGDEKPDTRRNRRRRRKRKTAKKRSYVDADSPAEKDSSDEDWEINDYNKDIIQKRPKKIIKKRDYVEVVQEFNVDEKIIVEPIERGDVEYWLEKERNSTYFRTQSSKCERCVCGVPGGEDHHKLYHSPLNPFVCEICSRTFALDSERASHCERHYYTLRCVFCGFRCYDQRHMHHHIHDQHRTAIRCTQCGAQFINKEIFKKHYDNIHRVSVCDYCGKRLQLKSNVEKHIMLRHRHHRHTTNDKPQCPICKKTFKQWKSLENHSKNEHEVCSPEAAYCVQCDKQFENRKKYQMHVYNSLKHAREWKRQKPPTNTKQKPKEKPKQKKSVQCPECPKVYATKKSYRDHYRLVHEKKITFQCHMSGCSNVFARKKALDRHILYVHKGYEPPKNKFCEICGRGFQSKTILTHHIRTHTGERPHACPHCDAKFAQKVAMVSHVKNIHKKKQQF